MVQCPWDNLVHGIEITDRHKSTLGLGGEFKQRDT